MSSLIRTALVVSGALLAHASAPAATQVDLILHGETAPGGDVAVSLTGAPGSSSLLFIGTAVALAPVATIAGPFQLDLAAPWFVASLAPMPAGGSLQFGAKIPNDPSLLGVKIHLQAYAGQLSNHAGMVVHKPTQELLATGAGERFGEMVLGGDLDGLAGNDVAITAVRGDNGAGEVRLFHGASLTPGAVLRDPTPQDGGRFGAAMVSADLTGDGVPDLVISAAGAGAAVADNTGEVWVFHGPSFQTTTLLAAPVGLNSAGFGVSLAAGDFDGDGKADLAVGVPGATVGGVTLAGEVHLFRGPSLSPLTILQEPAPETDSLFGGVLSAGDVEADGVDELLVGVPGGTVDFIDRAGEAFLFRAPFTVGPTRFVASTPSFGGVFGCRVLLDDVVGGPDLDVITGTPGGAGSVAGNPFDVDRVGEVEIFADADPQAGVVIDDPTPEFFQHFGMDVQTADVDGDGNRDLVVGVFLADSPFATDAGEVWVFLGPALRERLVLSAPSPAQGAQFGVFLDGVDLDQDGREELVIGAPFDDLGGVDAGRAYAIGFP